MDAADVGEDVVELAHVAHLEREAVAHDAVGQGLHAAADDVDARIRERAREVLEQVVAVERLDHELDPEGHAPEPLPVHLGEALGVLHEGAGVLAVAAVDGDALAEGDVAHDVVAGDGLTALGHADHDVAHAFDGDPEVAGEGLRFVDLWHGMRGQHLRRRRGLLHRA